MIKRYNEITGQWEVIGSANAGSIKLDNPEFSKPSGDPVTVSEGFSALTEDLELVKANIAWLFKNSTSPGIIDTITPHIKDDVWWIGPVDTGIPARGKSPEFRKGDTGIEWRYQGESDWTVLVLFEDLIFKFSELTPEQIDQLRLKYEDLTPEQIAELQKPANDMIVVLEQTNTTIQAAENSRVTEWARIKSEAEDATEISKEATQESKDATAASEAATIASQTATANANQATTAANTATGLANTATTNANLAAQEARDAAAAVEDGKTPVLQIGNVQKGTTAAADLIPLGPDPSGNPIYSLDMTLPKGDRGAQGLEPILQGGTTTTLNPGEQATSNLVPNGTDPATGKPIYKLDLGLPKGDQGSMATGDAKDLTVTFTEATTRTPLNSGEKMDVLFGKVKKWFSDLKTLAFTGKWGDVLEKPTTLDGYEILNESTHLASQVSLGKMIYTDPTFAGGLNGIEAYGTPVEITQVQGVEGNPNNSGYALRIRHTGSTAPSAPGLGGFFWGTQSAANKIFITRIIAKIPEGYALQFGSNSTGEDAKNQWMTRIWGTGKWEEYIHKGICGTYGNFHTTNFFWISVDGGAVPTPDSPMDWYISSATVYDATDPEMTLDTRYATKTELRRTTKVIDAEALDENTYYPVLISLYGGQREPYEITVSRTLDSSLRKPTWATHASGFSLMINWSTTANGYGTAPINRYIKQSLVDWTVSSWMPVGDIGQLGNGSMEYIFVRGGSKYTFEVVGQIMEFPGIEIFLSQTIYTNNGQSVQPKDSILRPANDRIYSSQVDQKIEDIQVGARNLILDSNIIIDNSDYRIHHYTLSRDIEIGYRYTMSLYGELSPSKTGWGIYLGSGSTQLGVMSKVRDGLYILHFTGPQTVSGDGRRDSINIFTLTSSQTGPSRIERVKLETGDKWTDYTEAPEDITSKITNIQIGGTNYLRNSGEFREAGWNSGWKLNNNLGNWIIDTNQSWNGKGSLRTIIDPGLSHPWVTLENGVEYTYSALVKSDTTLTGSFNQPLHWWAGKGQVSEGKVQVVSYNQAVVAGVWTKVWVTFKLSSDADSFKPYFYSSTTPGVVYNVAYLKLERGNKATDWCPSIEDSRQWDGWKSGFTGKKLYKDEDFSGGVNEINPYDNSATLTITREDGNYYGVPNISKKVLKLNVTAAGPNGYGGFSWNTLSAANKVYITRLIAWIPEGYKLNFATNQIGDDPTYQWLTNNVSVGGWKEYIFSVQVGSIGVYSTTNFFYLTHSENQGKTPSEADPLIWLLGSATVYEATAKSDDIDSVQVGGTNLLIGSSNFDIINGNIRPNYQALGALDPDVLFRGNRVIKITRDWEGIASTLEATIEPTVVSFYARAGSGGSAKFTSIVGQGFSPSYPQGQYVSGDSWKQYSILFPQGTTFSNSSSQGFLEFSELNGSVWFSSIKIEKGTKATDWSPAPQDLTVGNYLQIGGRNLWTHTKTLERYQKGSEFGNNDSSSTVTENGFTFTRITAVNDGNFYCFPTLGGSIQIKANESYTVSFYYKTDHTTPVGLYCYLFEAGSISGYLSPSSEWTHFSKTYIAKTTEVVTAPKLVGFADMKAGKTFDIRDIKLEVGNKATDWSPAPEELDILVNSQADSLYLRGSGCNRSVTPSVNLNGKELLTSYARGLNLIIIRRSNYEVLAVENYDTYGYPDTLEDALAGRLNALSDDVYIAIVSFDAQGITKESLLTALERCGGNYISTVGASRYPYAFLGIPTIGAGNGLEVLQGEGATEPVAEISTMIRYQFPVGMNYLNGFGKLLDKTVSGLSSAINTLQTTKIDEYRMNVAFYDTLMGGGIGGTNLVLDSRQSRTGTSYNIGNWNIWRDWTVGEPITVTVKGTLPVDQHFGLWLENGSTQVATLNLMTGPVNTSQNLHIARFNVPALNSSTNRNIGLYVVGDPSVEWTFEWIKIERGNTSTDWSANPSDVAAASHTHMYAAASTAGGVALASTALRYTSTDLTTSYAQGITYSAPLEGSKSLLFPTSNNANAVMTLNTHPGDFYSQLGFSSNGKIYYRTLTGVPLTSLAPWKELAVVGEIDMSVNMNDVSSALSFGVPVGKVTRKTIVTNEKISQGYRSRVALGLSNPGGVFSPALLSVGLNDDGTTWRDFEFRPDGTAWSGSERFAFFSQLVWGNIQGSLSSIPSGADLNSYINPGFWRCVNNTIAESLVHSPTTKAFCLQVGQHAGVCQRLVEYSTSGMKIFIRNFYNKEWGAWGEEYTSFTGVPWANILDKPTIPAAYTLPAATDTVRGGIKVGTGLNVTGDVLSNGIEFYDPTVVFGSSTGSALMKTLTVSEMTALTDAMTKANLGTMMLPQGWMIRTKGVVIELISFSLGFGYADYEWSNMYRIIQIATSTRIVNSDYDYSMRMSDLRSEFDAKYQLKEFFDSWNESTSLSALQYDKHLVIVTTSSASNLIIDDGYPEGREVIIQIVNPSTSFSQPLPNNGDYYSMDGDILEVPGDGAITEISIIRARGIFVISCKTPK